MSVYAIKHGRCKGIFDTWAECAKYVLGIHNAEYKKFNTEDEAEIYLNGVKKGTFAGLTPVALQGSSILSENKQSLGGTYNYADLKPSDIKDGDCVAFVNGAFSKDRYNADSVGFGVTLITSNGVKQFSGSTHRSDLVKSRNISGELLSAMVAVEKASELGVKCLTIVHNYLGISNTVTGAWSTNSDISRLYKKYMTHRMKSLPVYFKWFKGHTDTTGNVMADKLAHLAAKSSIDTDINFINKF